MFAAIDAPRLFSVAEAHRHQPQQPRSVFTGDNFPARRPAALRAGGAALPRSREPTPFVALARPCRCSSRSLGFLVNWQLPDPLPLLSQAPQGGETLFDILGLPRTFDVDLQALSRQYRALQAKLHPDKFARASPQEQGQQTAPTCAH